MKKKIAAFAMAAMLTMTTAMGASASNDESTYTEPHPVIFGVQNTRATSNFGACTISSGSTMGFSSGNNGWTFSKGSSVTFTFYTKEKASLTCGYYQGSKYTNVWHSVSSSGSGYVYTCKATIPSDGQYKFFISNKDTKNIHVTSAKVSN